jgi:fructokinase
MRIGIDLGGTKIEAIALDGAGHELRRIRVATPRGDYDATVSAIAALVHQVEDALQQQGTVGVGIPGTVVRATRCVKNANSLWLNGRTLEDDLSLALKREVRCANDANCFAISEAVDGSAKDAHVVFGVIMGTGCGGGLAIGGKTHAGPNGLAGEWGHTPLPWATRDELPGQLCYCGQHGCLETWISGTGFEWDFARVTSRNLRGAEIVAAANVSRAARGLAVIVNVVDPDVIVLGGGLSNLDRLYRGDLIEKVSAYSFGGGVTTPILRNVHGDSSGVRGAAWLWPQTP